MYATLLMCVLTYATGTDSYMFLTCTQMYMNVHECTRVVVLYSGGVQDVLKVVQLILS